jgi:hypothetical protein
MVGLGISNSVPSIFDGLQLLPKLPRYATPDEKLRLDNPSAARFREIIDGWLSGDSASARAKTRTDLLDRRNSAGTFHELLLREVLGRKFGPVEREPQGLPVGAHNPDFAVRVGRRGRVVVFESASIAERVDDRTRPRREMMRRLDRISGSWHLCPEWSWSRDLETVAPRVVEAAVRHEVAGLPPGKHQLDLHFGAAVFRATLLPASKHRDSIVSMDSSMGLAGNPGVASIQDDIKAKTARYRGLKKAGIPFILSIGTDQPLIDWESMFSALYGDEQVTFTFQGDEVIASDEGRLSFSGKITPSPTSEPRHRTMSAAWLVRWLMQNGEVYAEVVHFPNPWASNPVRIVGVDISRVTFRRLTAGRVVFLKPRRLRWLRVS